MSSAYPHRRPWIELGVIVAAVLAMPLVLPAGQRGAPPAAQPAASAPAAPGAGSLLHAGPDSALIVDILRPDGGEVFIGVQHLRGAETGKTIYSVDCSRQTLEDLRTGRRRSWAGADSIWTLLGRAACEQSREPPAVEPFGAPGAAAAWHRERARSSAAGRGRDAPVCAFDKRSLAN